MQNFIQIIRAVTAKEIIFTYIYKLRLWKVSKVSRYLVSITVSAFIDG